MNIDLQQLLVALFLLVPGFISTEILKSFSPKKYDTDFQWVVSSLLISLVLNALLIFFVFLGAQIDFQTKLSGVSSLVQEVSFLSVSIYILILYILSIIWGCISGRFPLLGVRAFLNHLGLVPYASNPSVWDRLFEASRPEGRPVTWLKYTIEKKTYLAHLRHSSEHIDMDKSFEVYVDRVHCWEGNSWKPLQLCSDPGAVPCDGMYLRMTPERATELYFTDLDWSPTGQSTASAG